MLIHLLQLQSLPLLHFLLQDLLLQRLIKQLQIHILIVGFGSSVFDAPLIVSSTLSIPYGNFIQTSNTTNAKLLLGLILRIQTGVDALLLHCPGNSGGSGSKCPDADKELIVYAYENHAFIAKKVIQNTK